MDIKRKDLTHTDRFGFVGVRLSNGQIKVLDECVRLTKQTRTELIREALSSFLYKLHAELKEGKHNEVA